MDKEDGFVHPPAPESKELITLRGLINENDVEAPNAWYVVVKNPASPLNEKELQVVSKAKDQNFKSGNLVDFEAELQDDGTFVATNVRKYHGLLHE